MELTNSTQIETWRQRLATENRIMKDRDQKAIEKHVDLLDTKNTYFNIYKKEEVKKKEEEDEVTKSKYGFDMTHEHDAVENKTWQKRKYGSQWAPEREKNLHLRYSTSQQQALKNMDGENPLTHLIWD